MLNQGYFPLTVSLNLLGKHKMPQTGSATCWKAQWVLPWQKPGRGAGAQGLGQWGASTPCSQESAPAWGQWEDVQGSRQPYFSCAWVSLW